MIYEVNIKPTAMKRVDRFIRTVENRQGMLDMHAAMCFPRATRAMVKIHSKIIPTPAVVVAFYDGDTTFRVFNTVKQAFNAFVEYKEEKAPCVLLTMNSVTLNKVEEDI